MSAITLYDAAEELRTLFDTLDGLEDPQEIAEFEKEMQPAFAAAIRKVENFAHYLAHLDSQAELCAAEIKRITERKKQFADRAAKLREYAIRSMQAHGVSKLESPTVTLRLQKNPPAVKITDMDDVPDEFQTLSLKLRKSIWLLIVNHPTLFSEFFRPEESVEIMDAVKGATCNTAEIAVRLKAGEEVPGARLEQAERLVIK